jgi:hypothetical protein
MCGLDWISPLVGLSTGAFTVEQTTLKSAPSKMVKHEKICYDNQPTFIPLVLDIFDFLTSDVVNLLQIVQNVMHIVCPRAINIIFKTIGFAIKKN